VDVEEQDGAERLSVGEPCRVDDGRRRTINRGLVMMLALNHKTNLAGFSTICKFNV
jgi:hypothetical protein